MTEERYGSGDGGDIFAETGASVTEHDRYVSPGDAQPKNVAPISVTNGDHGAEKRDGDAGGRDVPIPKGESDGGWSVGELGATVSEMLGGLEKKRQANLERLVHAQRHALMCGLCGKPFAAGEVIWRGTAPSPSSSGIRPTLAPMCDLCRCKGKNQGFDYLWAEAEACERCGRPVRNLKVPITNRRYVTCSEDCRRSVQKARASDLRALARLKVCATCREPFEGSRSDSRYCSPGCRQKAYRKRATGR
jgi:hypothetical protein